MTDPRDKVWEERADKAYSDLTEKPKRTIGKWVAIFVVAILALSVIGGAVSWVGSWGGEAKRITSPQNVREQNTQVIENYEGMKQAAANACAAKESAKQGGDPTFVERPDFAYAAKYREIVVDYNRRMNNLYEAQAIRHLPLPSNLRSYPHYAPSLREMEQQVC